MDPIIIILSLIIIVLLVTVVFLILALISAKKKALELKVYQNKCYIAEDRINEIDKEKKEFIDIIMHELNTPLAITSGYLSMILELAKDDMKPKILELVQKSYDSTQKMTDITNELLASSNEVREERPQGFQIEDMVKKIVDFYMHKAQEKGLSIIIHPPKIIPLPLILADPLSVRNAVSNILDNAIKFTTQGQISIALEYIGKEIKVSIADTGCGIPKEAQPRVYDKFFQADSSHTREVGGTGIGLYNAKNLIEAQGGKIWFDSQENNGTVFYITLPTVS
ncbi:HAMP domain-containing histidine kinase [bacterium]|nr:HAMP domain-containing histidine kinase [bacterium]